MQCFNQGFNLCNFIQKVCERRNEKFSMQSTLATTADACTLWLTRSSQNLFGDSLCKRLLLLAHAILILINPAWCHSALPLKSFSRIQSIKMQMVHTPHVNKTTFLPWVECRHKSIFQLPFFSLLFADALWLNQFDFMSNLKQFAFAVNDACD